MRICLLFLCVVYGTLCITSLEFPYSESFQNSDGGMIVCRYNSIIRMDTVWTRLELGSGEYVHQDWSQQGVGDRSAFKKQ